MYWMIILARIGICTPSWTEEQNTNVLNGQLNQADSVDACQSACISNASCTGVDWNPNNVVGKCWFSGPWSGVKVRDVAQGITHYNLNRNCTGKFSANVVNILSLIGTLNLTKMHTHCYCYVRHLHHFLQFWEPVAYAYQVTNWLERWYCNHALRGQKCLLTGDVHGNGNSHSHENPMGMGKVGRSLMGMGREMGMVSREWECQFPFWPILL